jgi:hypothetical protein
MKPQQLIEENAKELRNGALRNAAEIRERRVQNEPESSSSEEPEEIERRATKRSSSVRYARDADSRYVEQFLPGDRLCSEVVSGIYSRAYDQQLNPHTRGYWTGLVFYLMGRPKGSRIRDCSQQTLSALVSKTLAA